MDDFSIFNNSETTLPKTPRSTVSLAHGDVALTISYELSSFPSIILPCLIPVNETPACSKDAAAASISGTFIVSNLSSGKVVVKITRFKFALSAASANVGTVD